MELFVLALQNVSLTTVDVLVLANCSRAVANDADSLQFRSCGGDARFARLSRMQFVYGLAVSEYYERLR